MTGERETPNAPRPFVAFATTHWTQVLAAKGSTPESKAALSELCEHYYKPVRSFIGRRITNPEKAADLTHDFFARVLAGSGFANLDPKQSKFRTYLLGAVKHFLASQWRKDQTLKRGSGKTPESLSETSDGSDGSLQIPDEQAAPDDRQFDYDWAIQVMDAALTALENEAKAQHRAHHFEVLKPWLVGQAQSLSQKSAAATLGLSDGAVKVAIHRLRKQFRDHIKQEIRETIRAEDTIDDELRYLVEVLSGSDNTSGT